MLTPARGKETEGVAVGESSTKMGGDARCWGLSEDLLVLNGLNVGVSGVEDAVDIGAGGGRSGSGFDAGIALLTAS